MGDFNAIVRDCQLIPEDLCSHANVIENRSSKDKELNANGKQLLTLFDDSALVILNGRCKGDFSGELTFLGSMVVSVIDLCVVSTDILSYVEFFRVEQAHFSDHLPITVRFKLNVAQCVDTIPVLPKLRWKPNLKDQYIEFLDSVALDHLMVVRDDPIIGLLPLNDAIRENADKNNMIYQLKPGISKQKWFDRECLKSRKHMYTLLNKFRSTNSTAIRHQYLECSKQYKILFEGKKKEFLESMVNNFKEVRDSKD